MPAGHLGVARSLLDTWRVEQLNWLIEKANEIEEGEDNWRLLEPYFLGMVALFRQSSGADGALTASFVDCALGRRSNAYPQMAYCMRELRIGAVQHAIQSDADAHRTPGIPTGYDEYYARHMNYWSHIHHAFDQVEWEDDDMWLYFSGRRWLEERNVVPGLTGLLGGIRLNIGSSPRAVEWAEDRLAEGVDTPSLRILAGLSKPPNDFEVADLLEAVWKESGGEAKETAVLAKEHMVELALDSLSGRCSMDEGLRAGFDLARAIDDDNVIALWSAAEDDFSLARDGVTDRNEATVKANERLLQCVDRALS